MKKSFTTRRRGSALLIVLGFLSFMMVSAVAFSVYMRIERQASSNYRHATTGRHMLNSALCRAIDEVDSELRVERVNTEGSARPRKFPSWPGRTKPSAVPNGLDNSAECRVLSQESLSFIPASLVNDVRRYAITNKEDRVTGVNAANNAYSYLGTKWRPLSMPVASLGSPSQDAPNAYEEAIVGRYAYLCVNVSDMLDVNTCRASARDAVTNRVSLGHLFGDNTDTRRKNFDAYTESTAHRYETLQDFYACMYNNNGADGGTFGSPYHEYMNAGNSSDADAVFDDADLHVLVTDALAKAQPARRTACNILQQQPLAKSVLSDTQPASPASIALQDASVAGREGFLTALTAAFAGRLPGGADLVKTFPTCLADYLDEDDIPKQLNMPSVERAPMVSQFLAPAFFAPQIKSRPDPAADPADPALIYYLDLLPDPDLAQLWVEVAWPFKYEASKPSPAFTVDIVAYLKVDVTYKANTSGSFPEPPVNLPGTHYYLKLTGTVPAPTFTGKNDDDPKECFRPVMVALRPAGATTIDLCHSKTGPIAGSGFVEGQPLGVSLVVFSRIKQGARFVDSAPQLLPFPNAGGIAEEEEYMVTQNKLFLQYRQTPPVAKNMAVPVTLTWEWNSLEVPDARFNYKASNWVQNNADGNAIPAGGINPSTLALLGRDGRDGDIFLNVSNAGQLNSPYELGFVVRPFSYDPNGAAVDFRTQLTEAQSADRDAMFRTVRLYDHGDPNDKILRAADPLYLHFTAEFADGTVPGQRVNPLSTIPNVLWAAFDDTPLDYWYASRDITQPAQRNIMQDNTYTKKYGTADWNKLRNGWISCLTNTVAAARINEDWSKGLPQFYGSWQRFGWYTDGDATRVFNPQPAVPGVPVTVSKPLHEIDRKMLCGFSLDAFSDRQQLFLYFLRAEVTVPSFGTAQESGTRSLAGGRAVALVWRDPYPTGYNIEANNHPESTWYPNNRRISPWYQVNLGRYNDDHEPYSTDNSLGGANGRSLGYHEHRVLFFKQLEN